VDAPGGVGGFDGEGVSVWTMQTWILCRAMTRAPRQDTFHAERFGGRCRWWAGGAGRDPKRQHPAFVVGCA
jgi:hypothetical protein